MRSSVCLEAEPVPHIVKSTILDAPTDAVWNVLRDFNGHDRWHPAVATSTIERAQPSDRIGCVRRFKLKDGSELREQLLALSDLEQTFSYCLLDTPIPMFNYVAHVRLLPVTDGDRTFWHWESRFTTPGGEEQRVTEIVGDEHYKEGFDAIRGCVRHASSGQDFYDARRSGRGAVVRPVGALSRGWNARHAGAQRRRRLDRNDRAPRRSCADTGSGQRRARHDWRRSHPGADSAPA